MKNHLFRDRAPITEAGWEEIEKEAKRTLRGMSAGLEGGLVVSTRGGDFELSVGQDFSIGYLEHNLETVRLYIEESFTFLVLTQQAGVPLTVGGKKG